MALPVVTVASGGLPVVDLTADVTLKKYALGVSEAGASAGIRVTKVTPPAAGLGVAYVVPPP